MALSDIEEMNQSSNIQTLLNWQQICFTLHNCVWQKKLPKIVSYSTVNLAFYFDFFFNSIYLSHSFPFPPFLFFRFYVQLNCCNGWRVNDLKIQSIEKHRKLYENGSCTNSVKQRVEILLNDVLKASNFIR